MDEEKISSLAGDTMKKMHIALLLKLIPDSGEGETMEKNDWLTQARLALKTEDEDELFPD